MWGRAGIWLLIIAPVFISGAGATTVELAPIAIGNVVDDAGGIADGIFDRVESTTFPEVDATNNFTFRAVMEFRVASLPILSVNSAHLTWTIGDATDPPVTVQLYGYSGDGVLSIADAQQNNLVATTSIPQFGDGGVTSESIDVTSFVTSLVISNGQFAGFMFKLPIEPPFPVQKMAQFRDSNLEIDFTPTPLPSALPMFLTGLGMVAWLVGRRR